MKGGLGRGLSTLVSDRSVMSATGEVYSREGWAKLLLGDSLGRNMRATKPRFYTDPLALEMEIILCTAFICCYRRRLAETDISWLPRLRKLRLAIETESKMRKALLAHMELEEFKSTGG